MSSNTKIKSFKEIWLHIPTKEEESESFNDEWYDAVRWAKNLIKKEDEEDK